MPDPSPSREPEPAPHLAAAMTAVVLGFVLLWAVGAYARWLERRSIAAIAASEQVIDPFGELYRIKNQGVALQEAALDDMGLLPVYGSSELNVLLPYNAPYHPTNLFRGRPDGFAVFPVGKEAATCLILQQKLAAVAPALRGRKVAVSVSPFWFFEGATAWAAGYAGNFSPLQAGEVAFDTRLSLGYRQDVARRMLRYPETLADRPLLRFALENLADGSPMALALYDTALPLGMLHNTILRYQDHWSVVRYLWRHPVPALVSTNPAGAAGTPDWAALQEQADTLYRSLSDNNAFGLDNRRWDRLFHAEAVKQKNARSDADFLRGLSAHQEWADLELLLRLLTESGARPLLLSMPLHGGWYDHCGVSSTARRAYYEKLRAVAAHYHAPVVDFADRENDRTFCFDYRGHLSPSGWVRYDQVFDGFFHDRVPALAALPAASGRQRGAGAVSALKPATDRRR